MFVPKKNIFFGKLYDLYIIFFFVLVEKLIEQGEVYV